MSDNTAGDSGQRVVAPLWLVGGFAAIVTVIIAGGSLAYVAEERSTRRRVEGELETIAQLKLAQIDSWRRERLGDAALLVRRDGESILFLNELRHRPNRALELRAPLARADLPAAMAVLGAEGVVRGRDYRGVEVLAIARDVQGTPWHMIAKVDAAEALADWRARASLILLLMGVFVLASAAGILFLWQRYAKAHFRALYETEAARRVTDARYTATLLSIGDGVIAADTAGRIELMNPIAEKLTGWPLTDARGRTIDEVFRIIKEDDRSPTENPIEKILRGGHVVGLANHTVLVARDGSERPIANTGAPIRDPEAEDRVFGAVVVFRDQTDERQALAELRDSERRYRLLADNTLDVIWQMDLEARFTYVNPAVSEMFGYSPSEFVGTSLADHCDPERLETLLEIISHELEHLTDHTGIIVETVLRHRDGHGVPAEIHGQVLTDEHGAPTALQGTTRDLQERRRFENQLLQAQKLESVGRLAGGIAHDFNNMMQVILGHTEIAIDMAGGEGALSKSLLEIRDAAMRSANLTRQLLGFARRQTVAPRVLDLNQAVTGLLRMLRPLVGEDIDMLWRPGAELWPVLIDPSQVDQVLTNLTLNGRDAISGVGKMVIETTNVCLDAEYCAEHAEFLPGEYVMLAVSDDGCGMDEETLGHVFEPFYSTKTRDAGTGLGLATVYGIVRQNEGFINVYSEPGGGTTFRIYLPRQQEAGAETPVSTPFETPPHGGETVLVVEDEPSILGLCRSMLERLGYTVLTARTPGEALRTAEQQRGDIHLLLTDVVLPEMSGRDLAGTLQGSRPGLKCLYMSGYTANVIAHRGVLDHGLYFIQKPFSLADLAAGVRRALDG